MSVAAVANKEDKKPLYKDYVSFLGSYKQGRKDEVDDKEDRCSPSISCNDSSASITSDLNDMPKKSFKEYLENYNNKKFNPVQADFKKNPNQNVEGKMVKTEVFIDINNDINSTGLISKTFDLNVEPHKEFYIQKSGIDISSSISDEQIIAESQEDINTPVFLLKTNHELGKRNINVEKISQEVKNEELPQRKIKTNIPSTEIKKHPLKKTSSITEKSKIFEKISTKNTANSRVEAVVGVSSPTRNGCLPPKPVLHRVISSETQKDSFIKPKLAKKSVDLSTGLSANIQHKNSQSEIVSPEIVSPEKSTTGSPLSATAISCSTPPQKNISCGVPPPPPPPLPVNTVSSKKLSISPKPNFYSKGKPTYNTMPKMQNTRQVDSIDGCAPPALDKHDPRVKKMVYGALREMYGSYHDKANDYLATLPKNRVKKNNGLDSIINSIASQGGLEKLTGRGNPKVEAE